MERTARTKTNGSLFSDPAAIDSSRDADVAHCKSSLSSLLIAQGVIKGLETLNLLYSAPQGEIIETLTVLSAFLCFISVMIGEIGKKRSQVNTLKLYMFLSSIKVLLSVSCISTNNLSVKVSEDLSGYELNIFQIFKTAGVLLGLLVQTYSITSTITLIHYMSPSKIS